MSREDCSDSSTSTSNGFSGSPAADTTAFAGSMVVTSGDSLDASAVYPIAMEGCGDSEDSGDVGWSNPDAVMKGNAMEEKIFVTVRLRPLNSKEISGSERLAWECSDDKTVVCLYNRPDRHFPQSYSFDQVFGPEIETREVYERGAKDVALSALTGKNATIFAYGQTCSGKTYTMNGITENAADDIFSYIKEHDDLVFVLKFSALEIYNEVASDLLNPESGPLRIMDDPERGTVIEKLVEETVRDKNHLLSLLAVCEAHRQVGETVLNDISSRSHQIIKLTIESSPLQITTDDRPVKTLVAALNFVDLAGSERASLTQSEGTTLKEGCYINRSLLTLSTVIRKLSDPNRPKTAHIPYRESKLTRILSNALGGNARTAIICTMSPSNRHVDQTRYTLFFASCAKEVTNRAQVNVVISEKDLIKQLKKEVAILEAELRRTSISSQSSINELLLEKDLQIQKMQREMQKALQQRDSALSQLDDYRQGHETKQPKSQVSNKVDVMTNTHTLNGNAKGLTFSSTLCNDASGGQRKSLRWKDQSMINGSLQLPIEDLKAKFGEKQTSVSAILLEEIYKLEHLQNELAQDANRALEVVQKEVECLCLTQTDMNQEAAESVAKLQAEISEIYESRVMGAKNPMLSNDVDSEGSKRFYSLKDEIQRVASEDKERPGDGRESFQEILTNMHITFGEFGLPSSQEQLGNEGQAQDKCNQALVALSKSNGMIEDVMQTRTQTQAQTEESIRSVYAFVSDMKEKMSKLQYQKQLLLHRVLELERNGNTDEDGDSMAMATCTSPERWKSEFSTKQRQIFELWDTCNVSIIHRSQFYLLFRGDYADKIYLEVELRRLTWLKSQQCGSVNNPHRTPGGLILRSGEQVASPASSMRTLKRERESLIKYMNTRLTGAERQELYIQWGIPLETKQRKVKLAYMVWTKCDEEGHVKMSAELVSRLVTLWNKNGPVSKEMFQLSFSAPQSHTERTIWSPISNLFKAL